MEKRTRSHLDHIRSKDRELQNRAFFYKKALELNELEEDPSERAEYATLWWSK